MKFWVDAQLSPALAPWLRDTFAVEAFSVRWLGLQHADDEVIFAAARETKAVVITKDRDFVHLLERHGPPPRLIEDLRSINWGVPGRRSKISKKP